MNKFDQIKWNLRKSGYLDFYYYVKFFLHIVFHSFDIAKALDDSMNILGQSCDPDKSKHGFMHISAKKRQEIIDKFKVLPNSKWRNFKNGKFDVSICEKPAKVFLVWGIEGLAPVSISAYTAREAADHYFKDSLSVEKVFCVEKKFGAKLFIFERTLKKAS